MAIKSNKTKAPRRYKEYVLPSAGFKYNDLIPEGKIKVRSFNFETEQIMIDDSLSIQEKLNKLTLAVWDMPQGMDLNDLYQFDQLFILMCAWDVSTGKSYELPTKCTNVECGHVETHRFPLPEGLQVKRLNSAENIKITLPDATDKLEIDFATVGHAAIVEAKNKYYKNIVKEGDKEYILNIASNISTVNGGAPEDIAEMVDYLEGLDGPDVPSIRKALKEGKPGVNRVVPIECERCQTKYSVTLNLDHNFFLGQV